MSDKTIKLINSHPIECVAGEQYENKRIRIRALSGEVINHWTGSFIMDFFGMKRGEKIPIDHNHDIGDIIGFANQFTKIGNQLFISGELVSLEEGDTADKLIKRMSAGIPYQASITFKPGEIVTLAAGEKRIVNDHKYEGPLDVFKSWELIGVAITPYGADGQTSVRMFSAGNEIKPQPKERTQIMPDKNGREEFQAFVAEFGEKRSADYFLHGLSVEEGRKEIIKELSDENKALCIQLAEKDAKIKELEDLLAKRTEAARPVQMSAPVEDVKQIDDDLAAYCKKHGGNYEKIMAFRCSKDNKKKGK